jgi:hypothetical protein
MGGRDSCKAEFRAAIIDAWIVAREACAHAFNGSEGLRTVTLAYRLLGTGISTRSNGGARHRQRRRFVLALCNGLNDAFFMEIPSSGTAPLARPGIFRKGQTRL